MKDFLKHFAQAWKSQQLFKGAAFVVIILVMIVHDLIIWIAH